RSPRTSLSPVRRQYRVRAKTIDVGIVGRAARAEPPLACRRRALSVQVPRRCRVVLLRATAPWQNAPIKNSLRPIGVVAAVTAGIAVTFLPWAAAQTNRQQVPLFERDPLWAPALPHN